MLRWTLANVLPWADKYLSQRVATASPRTTYWPICLLQSAMFVWLSCFRSLMRCTRAKPAPWRGLYGYAIERRDHSQCIFYLHSRGVQDAHRRGSCRYQNLSVTFVSYTLQKCDWPYSAVESAQPGPSFEKLRLRNLWCCQDLTSLNLRAMEWCQHLWLRVVKLWTSSKCVEEECMPRLHHLKLGANYILESTPKFGGVQSWYVWKILVI
jgi:hypothetical protein